jgi:hypothetical protein
LPKEPHVEQASTYWLRTRAELNADELERPLGDIRISASRLGALAIR